MTRNGDRTNRYLINYGLAKAQLVKIRYRNDCEKFEKNKRNIKHRENEIRKKRTKGRRNKQRSYKKNVGQLEMIKQRDKILNDILSISFFT